MNRFFKGFLITTAALSTLTAYCQAEDLVEAFERPVQVPKVKLGTDRVEAPRGRLDLEKTDADLRAAEQAILGGVAVKRTAATGYAPQNVRKIPTDNRQEVPAEVIEALDSATAAGIVTQEQREMILPTKKSARDDYWSDDRPAPTREASADTTRQLQSLQAENKRLKQDLDEMRDMLRDLQNTKDRLMVAETEVERLEKVLSARNNAALQLKSTPVKYVQKSSAPSVLEDSDMPIVTVQVDKANLRAGPGTQHSVIMEIAKNTRLVVETRKGDWYRVTTPNGKRAWVASDVVAFGPSSGSSPTRTVKVRGYDDSIEEISFEQPNRSRPQ